MKIEDLQNKDGFVSTKLVKKSIKWESGGKEYDGDIFVRRVSFGVIDRIMQQEDSDHSVNVALIVETVRLGEKGEEQLTHDQAYSLDANLAAAMVEALMRVNGIGDQDSKKA